MNPTLVNLPMQSQCNFTLGGIVRLNSIFVPLSAHERHFYDVEKQMGRSTKPILETTVILPPEISKKTKKSRGKKVQKGGFKKTSHKIRKTRLGAETEIGHLTQKTHSPEKKLEGTEQEIPKKSEGRRVKEKQKYGTNDASGISSPHIQKAQDALSDNKVKEKKKALSAMKNRKHFQSEHPEKNIEEKAVADKRELNANKQKQKLGNDVSRIEVNSPDLGLMHDSDNSSSNENETNEEEHESGNNDQDKESSILGDDDLVEDEANDLDSIENEDTNEEETENESDSETETETENEKSEEEESEDPVQKKQKKHVPANQKGDGRNESDNADDMTFDLFNHPLKVLFFL